MSLCNQRSPTWAKKYPRTASELIQKDVCYQKLASAEDSERCARFSSIDRVLLTLFKNYTRIARPLNDLIVGHSTAKKDKEKSLKQRGLRLCGLALNKRRLLGIGFPFFIFVY